MSIKHAQYSVVCYNDNNMTEDHIEQSTLETLQQIGWQILHGTDIGPDGSGERDYRDTAQSIHSAINDSISYISHL